MRCERWETEFSFPLTAAAPTLLFLYRSDCQSQAKTTIFTSDGITLPSNQRRYLYAATP